VSAGGWVLLGAGLITVACVVYLVGGNGTRRWW
jgi:hypothetical protein